MKGRSTLSVRVLLREEPRSRLDRPLLFDYRSAICVALRPIRVIEWRRAVSRCSSGCTASCPRRRIPHKPLVLSDEQAAYIGVSKNGPYKPDSYRY